MHKRFRSTMRMGLLELEFDYALAPSLVRSAFFSRRSLSDANEPHLFETAAEQNSQPEVAPPPKHDSGAVGAVVPVGDRECSPRASVEAAADHYRTFVARRNAPMEGQKGAAPHGFGADQALRRLRFRSRVRNGGDPEMEPRDERVTPRDVAEHEQDEGRSRRPTSTLCAHAAAPRRPRWGHTAGTSEEPPPLLLRPSCVFAIAPADADSHTSVPALAHRPKV
jgi:hypothetical protein